MCQHVLGEELAHHPTTTYPISAVSEVYLLCNFQFSASAFQAFPEPSLMGCGRPGRDPYPWLGNIKNNWIQLNLQFTTITIDLRQWTRRNGGRKEEKPSQASIKSQLGWPEKGANVDVIIMNW